VAYFIINYLCITGAIVGWIVFSCEGWRRKVGITVGYLMISAGLFAFIQLEGATLASALDGVFGCEKREHTCGVQGSLRRGRGRS
jgi:hypothetical protein